MRLSATHSAPLVRHSILVCAMSCALLTAHPSALAQSADLNAISTLDKITVTAQSREQELQDVPIAMQVLDQRLLLDVTAENLKDLNALVPGLVVNAYSPTQPRYRLRGVENEAFGMGTDPTVGIFIDGIYGGGGGGSLLPFVDVERIEVLKGPQGTLFGRNTAAGAISLVTRRPQPVTEARATMRVGNYGRQYVDAMWNIPTSERSALRMTALSNRSDGWFQDAATGRDLGGDDIWATRLGWQTQLGDNTTAFISWEHERMDQNGRVITGIVPLPPYPTRPAVPVDPGSYLDPRRMPTMDDTYSEEKRTFDGVTLIVDHALEFGHLTSTTAWRQFDSMNGQEEDGTNRPDLYMDTLDTQRNENFYQEFKFSGSNARFDWVVGTSWYKEKGWERTDVNVNTESMDHILRGALPTPTGALFDFISSLTEPLGVPGISLVGDPWNEHVDNTMDSTSYALFGDVIWKLNDRLNLTLGLRYSRDEKEFTWFNPSRTAAALDAKLETLDAAGFFQTLATVIGADGADAFRGLLSTDFIFGDPPYMESKNQLVTRKNSWSDLSPRFVIDYHLNDDTMVFASLAKGYKAGGYSLLDIGVKVDNETVWNLEAGIKQTIGSFFYNASAYHYRYDDRQAINLIQLENGLQRYVVDNADLEATGIELDMRWKASNALSLDGNLTWTDSSYKNYTHPAGIDLTGAPTGEPRLSFSAGAVYRVEVGGGEMRLSARHAYRGRKRCNAASDREGDCGISPILDIGEPSHRTDLRLSWLSPQGTWDWALYANNVFDNRYVRAIHTYARPMGAIGASITDPRIWGMEVTVKF